MSVLHPASVSTESINTILNTFFKDSIRDASEIDPSYGQLWKSLHTLIASGGKRLRPQMTVLAYEAFGGTNHSSIAPIAAAQELLHFSLLIHDDIIDRDYTRYGVKNVAGQYKDIYAEHIESHGDLIHFSHSAAILGGDLVLSGAYSLITQSSVGETEKAAAHRILSKGLFEVAGGELLDTESSFVPYKEGNALKIARYKTASYSFVAPLLTGATLAGASDEQLKKLREFAINLGVAFQLVDDLLGVFGDEAVTGKSTTSDIIEGKRTYLVECATKAMDQEEAHHFNEGFGNAEATPEHIEAVKTLLTSTGAKSATEQKIAFYAKAAETILLELQLPEPYTQAFETLISKVTKRVL